MTTISTRRRGEASFASTEARVGMLFLFQYYHCDMARTFAFGHATDASCDRYRAVLEAEHRAIAAAGSGATARDFFLAGVEGARAAGIPTYDRTHCGHAIGLEVYEHPLVSSKGAAVLTPGMVLAIETPYYELGTGGFQPEESF